MPINDSVIQDSSCITLVVRSRILNTITGDTNRTIVPTVNPILKEILRITYDLSLLEGAIKDNHFAINYDLFRIVYALNKRRKRTVGLLMNFTKPLLLT